MVLVFDRCRRLPGVAQLGNRLIADPVRQDTRHDGGSYDIDDFHVGTFHVVPDDGRRIHILLDADGDAVEIVQRDDDVVAVYGGGRVVGAVLRGLPNPLGCCADDRVAVVAFAGAQRAALDQAAVGARVGLAGELELADQGVELLEGKKRQYDRGNRCGGCADRGYAIGRYAQYGDGISQRRCLGRARCGRSEVWFAACHGLLLNHRHTRNIVVCRRECQNFAVL